MSNSNQSLMQLNWINKLVIALLLLKFRQVSIFDQSCRLIAIKPKTENARFGDCLTLIYISLYLSETLNCPTLLDDFVEIQNLEIQKIVDEQKIINFKNCETIKINSLDQINLNISKDVIYILPMDLYEIFESQKNNISVKKKFKQLIKPIGTTENYCLKNHVNIALHIRKGGGFDLPLLSKDGLNTDFNIVNNPIDANQLEKYYKKHIFLYSDQRWPLKFPPDSYYIEQLKKIIAMHSDEKIYVHIFTDDLNPKKLAEKYSKAIDDKRLKFGFRGKKNHHSQNVSQDFFAMTKFDYLIRPCSTYSQIAQILGDFKMVISPKHGLWVRKDLLFIDQINIEIA